MERKKNWIMTYTGKHFHLADPKPEEVDREDIAHGISNICRFTGHTKYFYSVGTHSILCAEQARKDGMTAKVQLYCLLHDASESYLADINRPLKELLGNIYTDLEDVVMSAVWKHFNLPEPTDEEWTTVKHYDNLMLAHEIGQLMINADEFAIEPIYNGILLPKFQNTYVKFRFIEILEHLMVEYEEEKKNG